ncbi:DNA translocase FtsK [Ancylobacter defluvii]|uniref:DNA translocase FtsK n=1 Tax=Ancylobacter defluvii TaxID=1282440 RepID=A0A9W6K0C0_9HYPH|nr:DNA translocase FtsK [Ancylobacter defluvii]MBS7587097.1 DNA translocase FtsK [Ancylobacter defluvii]GLK85400.1 DNA translocase FtsK [Ancylobacter defluvii]
MGGQTQSTGRTPRTRQGQPRAASPDAAPPRPAQRSRAGASVRGRGARRRLLPEEVRNVLHRRAAELGGLVLVGLCGLMLAALASWSANDPSLSRSSAAEPHNLLGVPGAVVADLMMQLFGVACLAVVLPVGVWGWRLLTHRPPHRMRARIIALAAGTAFAAGFAACLPRFGTWPLPSGLGGVLGEAMLILPSLIRSGWLTSFDYAVAGALCLFGAVMTLPLAFGVGLKRQETAAEDDDAGAFEDDEPARFGLLSMGALAHWWLTLKAWILPGRTAYPRRRRGMMARLGSLFGIEDEDELMPRGLRREPNFRGEDDEDAGGWDADERDEAGFLDAPDDDLPPAHPVPEKTRTGRRPPLRSIRGGRAERDEERLRYAHPGLDLLSPPPARLGPALDDEALEQNARDLESVLDDFGVRGAIVNARPGPVVTLYELEPAPGIKSSRVIGLADDIARSMSAVSARVAVIPGKNAIGIELPNPKREKVLLREIIAAKDFGEAAHKLALALGKTIGGEPVIVDLARMPHLLVAGTTGSGKSVAINTMIMSLLYRHRPDQCRLILIDPKMLELSVYDGIPHLLSPVVTDPKKAVVALKWAVREMEERYRKMSKVGVRNIDGFNARILEAQAKGEQIVRTVQTGFDRETGEAIYEREEMDLTPLPYIVIVVDEMADLMMVAGKDIEGAIQRLAQMARAAGIHLIMATQRPSVDVITGTIKANFPTRISFQVTSKIDSRTILGEMGAEQLLGQGDMLYMAGGGRISRVHGPFVSDQEVERVVEHLKTQGQPDYLDAVTTDEDEGEIGEEGAVFDKGAMGGGEGGGLYEQAVAVVMRDRKASTSYIQRRLQIGYNRAASIMERMENEGLVSAANHAGKREILVEPDDARAG